MPNEVFLVHHVHVMPNGEENVKLLGVYQNQIDAINAVERAKEGLNK